MGLLAVQVDQRPTSTPFSRLVSVVVCPRARSKVLGVAAWRVVADVVAHGGRERLVWVSETPRDAVRPEVFAVHANAPVTVIGASGPFEAAVGLSFEPCREALRSRGQVGGAVQAPTLIVDATPSAHDLAAAFATINSALGSLHWSLLLGCVERAGQRLRVFSHSGPRFYSRTNAHPTFAAAA